MRIPLPTPKYLIQDLKRKDTQECGTFIATTHGLVLLKIKYCTTYTPFAIKNPSK